MLERQTIPDAVSRLHECLGPELYVVGGLIRDLVELSIRGETTDAGARAATPPRDADWDMATPLRPQEVMARLRRAGIRVVPVGIEHGTVVAVIDSVHYELTTYRYDVESIDGRHATVRFADSIHEDLQRRDFTVNAMAMDLVTLEKLDPFDGERDLRDRVIRTVGEPRERFEEDHLRLVRTARFAAKLEATIEPETLRAMHELAPAIQRISAERVRDEFMKLLGYSHPEIGIRVMRETGLLREVLPEFDACFGVEQNRYHSHDVGEHSLLTVEALHPKHPFLRWVALLHDIGKPGCKTWKDDREDYVFYGHQEESARMATAVMHRLRFSNAQIESAERLIGNHMADLGPRMRAGGARRLLRRVGPERIRDLLRLQIADRRGNRNKKGFQEGFRRFVRMVRRIERKNDALTLRDLKIGGKELIELGLSPGPSFSDLLQGLLERVLDDPQLNDRAVLLDLLLQDVDAEGLPYDEEAAASLLKTAKSSEITESPGA